jgi:hypothetical protein
VGFILAQITLVIAKPLRLDALQVFLFFDRADDAKADHVHAREPPDAFRLVRVVLDPARIGFSPRGAAAGRGIVAPGAATGLPFGLYVYDAWPARRSELGPENVGRQQL